MIKCRGMAEHHAKKTAQEQAYRAFEALVADEQEIDDLAEAALLIAEIAYPGLDHAHYLAQLAALAQRARVMLGLTDDSPPPEGEPLTVIHAINTILFEQEHFHGNASDYYNPANSFLNRVLEDRVGIPIALSALYMEVAKRVGIQLDGIGLPFHFVIAHRSPDGTTLYIDPFEQGRVMNEQECRVYIQRMAGRRIRFQAQWFEPMSYRMILVRMLNNLKNIYIRNAEYALALAVCDRLVLLLPAVAQERRDRGTIHLQLQHFSHALRDLKAYVKMAPHAEDRDEILEHIKIIRQTMEMMN